MQIEAPVALEPAVVNVDAGNRIPDSQQVRIPGDLQRVEQRAVRGIGRCAECIDAVVGRGR